MKYFQFEITKPRCKNAINKIRSLVTIANEINVNSIFVLFCFSFYLLQWIHVHTNVVIRQFVPFFDISDTCHLLLDQLL